MEHISKYVPLEKDFQKWFLKKLREIPGTWWLRLSMLSLVGLPDIIGCVAGVFFAIELKTRSKVTAIQAHTLRSIEKSGGQVFVGTPDNAKEILEFVTKISQLGPRADCRAKGL